MDKFEIGEKVLINRGVYGESIAKIDTITPKGFYKIGRTLYNPNGHARGGGTWTVNYIQKLTPDLLREFTSKRNKWILRNTDWRRVSDDNIEKVIEIIKQNDKQLRGDTNDNIQSNT